MGGAEAESFFNELIEKMQSEYDPDKIASGSFGEMMKVSLVNDGPVTLNLDSRNRQNKDPEQILSRAGQSAASSSTNDDGKSQRD
jgi:D-tyrosyl-tRNA(Tyr) deacylase